MNTEFHKKYSTHIVGTISCFDRIIISGTLSNWGYPEAMRSYLLHSDIKIFDYVKLAKEINDQIRLQIESIVADNNTEIEYIRSPKRFDKQENIELILKQRGTEPGLVKIYSAMEACESYFPYFNKETNLPSIKQRSAKCIHYYIYFIDKILGLCFLRIPTWLPCRVQFYFNGHNYLASKLQKHNIDYTMEDNAFSYISDYKASQELSDDFKAEDIHQWFDIIIKRYVPFLETTHQTYRWSITQSEYSTDIIFKNSEAIKSIYEELVLKSIHTVKPGNIATFFSRKLAGNYEQEVGSKYNKQIHGTRIKHFMGANSIKMYDKGKTILRIETTVNDIKEFRVFREVNTRSGNTVKRYANMKKNIYSFYQLGKLCLLSNSRYLDYIASFTDNSNGKDNLDKLSDKKYVNNRSYKGLNFFDKLDSDILKTLMSGEFNINGFRNKSLRVRLKHNLSSSQISRQLKRLKTHGIIKKIKKTTKYYITKFGKRVISAGLIQKEFIIAPALN